MSQIFNIGLSFHFMNSRRIYIICFNTKGTSEDIKVLVKQPLITGLYP